MLKASCDLSTDLDHTLHDFLTGLGLNVMPNNDTCDRVPIFMSVISVVILLGAFVTCHLVV